MLKNLLYTAAAALSLIGPAATVRAADIYDTKADAAADIASALKTAQQSGKHVLLQFGANWCDWCHELHKMFTTNAKVKQMLAENFIVVAVDVDEVDGQQHNAEVVKRYGNPVRHGLPVLVVLDAQGRQLTTQDTTALEKGDSHDDTKVLLFLRQWSPPRAH